MFRLFSKTVTVAFIDELTGKQIASSEMPLDQLPDTFALDTTLDMAGAPYVVVRAEPMTKAEFSKTKRLSIGLRRLESLDPKTILFSLPTISGSALPKTFASASRNDIVTIHEDDWRQCEFISCVHSAEISAELAGIQNIRTNEAAAVGWRKIHLRERIAAPLPAGVTWSTVRNLLGDVDPIGGVAFGRAENCIVDAVGARFPDGLILWGVPDHGALGALCVENVDAATPATISALKQVADEISCVVVHWCRCQIHGRDVTIENAAGALWQTAG